jgi:hypothetical protein
MTASFVPLGQVYSYPLHSLASLYGSKMFTRTQNKEEKRKVTGEQIVFTNLARKPQPLYGVIENS